MCPVKYVEVGYPEHESLAAAFYTRENSTITQRFLPLFFLIDKSYFFFLKNVTFIHF